jgi:hypothetical protein
LVVIATALLIFSARLIVPAWRPEGGRIIGRGGMRVTVVVYSFLLMNTLVTGTNTQRQLALIVLFAVGFGMAMGVRRARMR